MKLVVCTACGAHGTSRTVNLAKACSAQTAAAGERDAPYRRQARAIAKGLHPSRKDVKLRGLRPLRLAVAWRAGKVAANLAGAGAEDTENTEAGPGQGNSAETENALDETLFGEQAAPVLQELQALEDSYAQEQEMDFDDQDAFDFGGDMGQAAYVEQDPEEPLLAEVPRPAVLEDPPNKVFQDHSHEIRLDKLVWTLILPYHFHITRYQHIVKPLKKTNFGSIWLGHPPEFL